MFTAPLTAGSMPPTQRRAALDEPLPAAGASIESDVEQQMTAPAAPVQEAQLRALAAFPNATDATAAGKPAKDSYPRLQAFMPVTMQVGTDFGSMLGTAAFGLLTTGVAALLANRSNAPYLPPPVAAKDLLSPIAWTIPALRALSLTATLPPFAPIGTRPTANAPFGNAALPAAQAIELPRFLPAPALPAATHAPMAPPLPFNHAMQSERGAGTEVEKSVATVASLTKTLVELAAPEHDPEAIAAVLDGVEEFGNNYFVKGRIAGETQAAASDLAAQLCDSDRMKRQIPDNWLRSETLSQFVLMYMDALDELFLAHVQNSVVAYTAAVRAARDQLLSDQN